MKVIITNHQDLVGLTSNQRHLIQDRLTFDNPAYKKALKFSRYAYTTIPKYLEYYSEKSVRVKNCDVERKKLVSIPTGVHVDKLFPDENIVIEDRRISHTVKYPSLNVELRIDQNRAKKAYINEVSNEKFPRQIIQLPTGKGKSILALVIAKELGQKTLILVHKDDLVTGWKKDIKLCFGEKLDVGLIKAKSRKIGDQITIATVQTLNRMSAEELDKLHNEFGLVIQDEVHHLGLNIFNVIDKFNSRYRLGLSATPYRTDGLNFVFDLFFGGIVYKHESSEDDEDICNVLVRPIESSFKFEPFIYKGEVFNYYDYSPKELPENIQMVKDIPYDERPRISYLSIDSIAVKSEITMKKVCDLIYSEYKAGHSILALFTQKEHINLYYECLKVKIPDNKIMLYYGDSKESSAEMIRKAESKEVLITLATYAKATEGTNVKSWEVEFLVSSLNNTKNVEQATGRIRRKKDGKLNPVIVYDIKYSGCYSLRNHFNTRLSTYRRLKYKVEGDSGKRILFSRGYN